MARNKYFSGPFAANSALLSRRPPKFCSLFLGSNLFLIPRCVVGSESLLFTLYCGLYFCALASMQRWGEWFRDIFCLHTTNCSGPQSKWPLTNSTRKAVLCRLAKDAETIRRRRFDMPGLNPESSSTRGKCDAYSRHLPRTCPERPLKSCTNNLKSCTNNFASHLFHACLVITNETAGLLRTHANYGIDGLYLPFGDKTATRARAPHRL